MMKLISRTLQSQPDLHSSLFVLSLLLLAGALYQLPAAPTTFLLQPLELGLLLFISVSFLLSINYSFRIAETVFAICIILGLSILTLAGQPAFKTVTDTIEYNQEQAAAIAAGITLAEANDSLSDITIRIHQAYPEREDLRSTATEVAMLKLQDNKPLTIEVQREVIKQVPVGNHVWKCNEFGCGYSDLHYVWTVDKSQRQSIAILVVPIAVALLFITYRGRTKLV